MTEEVSMDDREREEEELADFDIGFQARLDDEPLDETASEAWKRGWHDGGMDSQSICGRHRYQFSTGYTTVAHKYG